MVITFTNFRGGSGKTTSVINVGASLHRKGYKVLLIDCDSQENLTYAVTTNVSGTDVVNLIQDQGIHENDIYHLPEFDLIAGNPALSALEKHLPKHNPETRLKNALETLKDKYDFILMDTSPMLSFSNISAIIASDGVIIPAQADPFSIQGIKKLSGSISSLREKYNPDLKILGIVITRYNQRTVIRLQLADLLANTSQSIHTRVYTPIRECTALLESITVRKSIFEYAPKSNGAKDYDTLTNEILETINTNGGIR